MNKLTARRSFRHGGRTVNPGDVFEASPADTRYYTQYGWADVVEEPRSRRNYDRRDMQAAPDLVEAAVPAPRRRGRPSATAQAEVVSQPEPEPLSPATDDSPSTDSVVEAPNDGESPQS